jgi:hypothetical protein
MQETTGERLQIAYTGPALEGGRMPMLALGNALRGQALLIQRVKDMLHADSVAIRVEIDPTFESGSLIIPVHILTDAYEAAKHTLAGEGFTALANLLAILGFGGVTAQSLFKFFKRMKGRPIERPEDFPKDLNINIKVELFIRIYNDPEVQAQLRKTVGPLRQEGVEEFQTLRSGIVLDQVSKSDVQAADEAEVDRLTTNEEIGLAIEKAAWRRNLAWHFNDGQKSFDAKIDDENFWKRVEGGEPFADGDRLIAHLQTTARRTPSGDLKVERRIPTVLGVEHARRVTQKPLFSEDQPDEKR